MKLICQLTDEDALEVANILGGVSELPSDSKIEHVRNLFCTNKLFCGQTNIPGIVWYRVFKYLESKEYHIE